VSTEEDEEQRAFVVVRHRSETWVRDLAAGDPFTIGAAEDASLRIPGASLEETQCTLRWDGSKLSFESSAAGTFLGGKRFTGTAELKPGDELALGNAQAVVGISAPLTAHGRRALTHNEFRDRLYEEMARAARGGRPTALVMVSAKSGDGGKVTNIALSRFRAGDVVATYASDEPEFLLPDTDGETATLVVKRVLDAAEADAAAGLAIAPEHGENPERLIRAAREALAEALREGGGIAEPPSRTVSSFDEALVSVDPATTAVVSAVGDAAADRAPVLLVGEPSTGKSIFVRLLHEQSPSKEGALVPIYCASLLEEEHAATFGEGGEAARAKGGTLLLDEVGELSQEGQEKLLAFLEANESELRIAATTNRALAALAERGAFDPKLYEMLSSHIIEIPALRNRPEDILPLAERFAVESGARTPVRISPAALARLRSYPWPGNVLELRNAMERAVRLARDGDILAEHLPNEPMPIEGGEGRLREHVDNVERDAIIKALADSNHNQTHAAKRLGISRRALIYKMEKYGLKRPPKGSRR